MTKNEIEHSQEAKAITMAGDLWNQFLKCEPNENDRLIVMENIHRIQDMMYTSLFIKIHGKL